MKVFISWSGDRSKAIAESLRYWLPKVIQAIHPWMSANDIEKGTYWRGGLTIELEQSSVGIICLTPENIESPWIHFEAGALSKLQQNTRVCTFLFELDPVDVRDPLAQFQTTKAQKDDLRKLIHTINNSLGEVKLSETEINESFDVWWPKLEERLNDIPVYRDAPQFQREEREILEEILELVRFQSRKKRDHVYTATKDSEDVLISGNYLSLKDAVLLSEKLGKPPSEILRMVFLKSSIDAYLDAARNESKVSPLLSQTDVSNQEQASSLVNKEESNENSNS